MRNEQEIFDELARLCTSPGYVHAVAYLCFRDNVVRYQGEMTSDDMRHLFSKERLVRTEISTLIGLLVNEDVDFALPTPEVTQKYVFSGMNGGEFGVGRLLNAEFSGPNWLTGGLLGPEASWFTFGIALASIALLHLRYQHAKWPVPAGDSARPTAK